MLGCSFAALARLIGWPGILLCLALLSASLLILMRFLAARKKNADSNDSLLILKRRLATGEITLEEFTILKQYL
jgi:putative membrane protein